MSAKNYNLYKWMKFFIHFFVENTFFPAKLAKEKPIVGKQPSYYSVLASSFLLTAYLSVKTISTNILMAAKITGLVHWDKFISWKPWIRCSKSVKIAEYFLSFTYEHLLYVMKLKSTDANLQQSSHFVYSHLLPTNSSTTDAELNITMFRKQS